MRLRLIGGFDLVIDGQAVVVPHVARRLLVFLALQGRTVPRSFVAGSLWPETTDTKARASLRSTLWRLSQLGAGLVQIGTEQLALAPAVSVDLDHATRKSQWILDRTSPLPEHLLSVEHLDEDLLPEWDEDWLRKVQMAFRQRRLRALEGLSTRLSEAGRHWEAVEAGLEAVAAEPLRESAHRALVLAYVADGNWADGIRQFRAYRDMLHEELGVEPSPAFEEILGLRHPAANLALAGNAP